MPRFYGPPSDGTVIPQQIEDALVADVAAEGSPLREALDVVHAHSNPPILRGSRTIVLGDSIDANTAGWFPYWAIGSKRVPVIRNAGVGGDTTAKMLARMDADVLAYRPDVVILGGSTNDQGSGVAEAITRQNIETMVSRVVGAGAVPVLRTTPPVNLAGTVAPWNTIAARRQAVQRHNAWLKLWAQRRGIDVIDLYAAAADPLTGDFKAGYSTDGLHPTEAGAKAIADKLVSDGLPPVFRPTFALARAKGEGGNLMVNGVFHDTDGNGLADQWVVSSGGAAAVTSVTPGDADMIGGWQRLSSDGSVVVAITSDSVRGADTYEIGDVLAFSGRVRTSGGASVRIQVMAYGGTGSVDAVHNATQAIAGGVFSGRMIPQGDANQRVRFLVQLNAGAAGWVEVSEIAVRNLTALGLA